MGLLSYKNVKIRGISCCVPKNIIDNKDQKQYGSEKEIDKYISTTNVRYRRIADSSTTSLDLCFSAAKNLLDKLAINKNEINALIFVTQTPDYFLPAGAIILQDRLGLSNETIAFDVNLGCSGYVNGLNIGFSFLQNPAIKNVLLLCGDTISKLTSEENKTTGYLFGDAGSATLLQKSDENSEAYFSLNSDGSDADFLKVESGAFRHNGKGKRELEMDGMGVFNFTINKIPKDVKKLLTYSKFQIEDIDYVVYHQANKFINDFISKKLKIDKGKTPFSMYKYGNTSSASIPLTIVNNLKNKFVNKKKVLFSGFGVGLSWGHCILDIEDIIIPEIVEI